MPQGSTSVTIVSDGTILLDGGAVFGKLPRSDWELSLKPDRRNRVRLALNCLLVQTPTKTILVDTGAGSKRVDKFRDLFGLNGNKLLRDLRKLGLTARDIDTVVLTHLHYDHCGGCTKLDRAGKLIPTFPKAEYMVQRTCWEEANDPDERGEGAYYPDDFVPLEESGVLTLLDGDTEIVPGVSTKVTDGHATGHQIVLVEAGSERVAYVGDLIPTSYHIPLGNIGAFDHSPVDTLKQKKEMLKMAVDKGWLLVFGHATAQRAGYVEERNGRAHLLHVDV